MCCTWRLTVSAAWPEAASPALRRSRYAAEARVASGLRSELAPDHGVHARGGGIVLGRALEQRGRAADRAERVAQLVAEHGEELVLGAFGVACRGFARAHRARRLAEGLGGLGDLADAHVARRLDAGAADQRLGRGCERGNGRGDLAGEGGGEQQREGNRRHHAGAHQPDRFGGVERRLLQAGEQHPAGDGREHNDGKQRAQSEQQEVRA